MGSAKESDCSVLTAHCGSDGSTSLRGACLEADWVTKDAAWECPMDAIRLDLHSGRAGVLSSLTVRHHFNHV